MVGGEGWAEEEVWRSKLPASATAEREARRKLAADEEEMAAAAAAATAAALAAAVADVEEATEGEK